LIRIHKAGSSGDECVGLVTYSLSPVPACFYLLY